MTMSASAISRRIRSRSSCLLKSTAIERLPFANAAADLVWSNLALHCMDDPLAGLRELARVLKPEGYANRVLFFKLWVDELDPSVKDPQKAKDKRDKVSKENGWKDRIQSYLGKPLANAPTDDTIVGILVDGVSSLAAVIADLNRRRMPGATQGASSMPITREQLAAEAPDLVAALQAEGAASERARIQAVEGQSMPGHEALIAGLKFDGKSTGADAAMAVLAAERGARSRAAAALAEDAPQPVAPAAVAGLEPRAADPAEDLSVPAEQRCKAKWEQSAEVRREFGSLAAYTAYVSASERGVARIMSK